MGALGYVLFLPWVIKLKLSQLAALIRRKPGRVK